MRKLLNSIITLIVITALFCCCNDDSATVPSYRTDILSVVTGSDSMVRQVWLDNGRKYNVSSQLIKGVAPNAKVRCLSNFSISEDSASVTIYDIKRISCYAPYPADSFKIQPHDPINVTSIWKSGGYINMCLAPKATGLSAFKYDFCIDSVTTSTSSHKRILHTSLLFQFTGAIDSYTTNFYHSLPLDHSLYPVSFDSLYLYINTYDGMKVWKY